MHYSSLFFCIVSRATWTQVCDCNNSRRKWFSNSYHSCICLNIPNMYESQWPQPLRSRSEVKFSKTLYHFWNVLQHFSISGGHDLLLDSDIKCIKMMLEVVFFFFSASEDLPQLPAVFPSNSLLGDPWKRCVYLVCLSMVLGQSHVDPVQSNGRQSSSPRPVAYYEGHMFVV